MLMSFLFVVFFMYVWFDTDVFVDYSRMLGFSEVFHIKEWDEWRVSKPKTGYLEFLSARKRGFFVKLISCKHCLCFWFSVFFCYCFSSENSFALDWLPMIYLGSYLGYNLYVWILWKLRRY